MTPINLWDFARQNYARPGVESLCLCLQDDWQAEVGLVLWLAWLEYGGHQLNTDQLRRAQAQLAAWQTRVVEPLRQLRRQIKSDYPKRSETLEACRQAIKSAELRAEQYGLETLASLAETWFGSLPQPALTGGSNLRLYADELGLPEALRQQLIQCLGSQTD